MIQRLRGMSFNNGIAFLIRSLLQRTIIRTILLSYLGINVLLLATLGLLSVRDSTAALTQEMTQSSFKIMEQAARGLSFNFEEATRPLVLMAGHYSVISLMAYGDKISVEERIQHERNIADLAFGVTSFQSLISDILILGKNGYINNLDGRKTLRWDYPFTNQPWFQEAVWANPNKGLVTLGLHKQNYYVTSSISKYNQPTLSIAFPVTDSMRKTVGAVIANLDLNKINSMFELSSYQKNENIFMVDENRTIMVHKSKESIGQILFFPGIANIYKEDSGSFISTIEGREQLVIYHTTSVKGLRMISTIPMSEISKQSSQLRSNLIGFLYLFLILNALTSVLMTIHIARPFRRLLSTVDSTGEDSLFVVPKNYKYQELNVIGNKFKELVNRIELLVKQNYVAQIAMKEVELKTLQSQIHPHFLFNTLQLLQTEIVCGHTEDSNHLVLSLSNLLRYSIRRSDETVELKQELQNVNDYLFIINRKYDNRIHIQTHIPNPAVLKCQTVKLILQPIVENAILHGFKENPQGAKLSIHIVSVKKGVLIEIKDNGGGMTKDHLRVLASKLENTESSEGSIGLYNVNQRLRLKFGPDYGLRIRSVQHSFTSVYVVLPDR